MHLGCHEVSEHVRHLRRLRHPRQPDRGMSQPPVLFRPSYRELKREADDVEMAIPARGQCVRAAMEL